MTIDEAIEKERKKADLHRFNSCNIDTELYADDPEEIENAKNRCIKCAEEHEQLAEWLEELKAIKEKGRYVQGFRAGYKVAIGDFVCYMCNEFDSKYAAIEEHTGEYVIKRVHSIAEELKAGGENE